MKTLPEKNERNWSRIGIIVLGVGFALLFVGTYIMSILTGTVFAQSIQEGDQVAVEFTIWDVQNRPIITTNQQLYSTAHQQGIPAFFSPGMVVVANGTYNESILGIDAYNPVTAEWTKYGMFGAEMEIIGEGMVGMRIGETKNISLSTLTMAPTILIREEYENIGGNFTTTRIGQMLVRAFTEQPEIPLNGTTPGASFRWRILEVVDKDAENITISYWYQTAQVKAVKMGTI
jgi:hypothetical protein